jgi:hypothetical protein
MDVLCAYEPASVDGLPRGLFSDIKIKPLNLRKLGPVLCILGLSIETDDLQLARIRPRLKGRKKARSRNARTRFGMQLATAANRPRGLSGCRKDRRIGSFISTMVRVSSATVGESLAIISRTRKRSWANSSLHRPHMKRAGPPCGDPPSLRPPTRDYVLGPRGSISVGTFPRIGLECALDSGQFQAAVLTGCWAWRSSYCAGLR